MVEVGPAMPSVVGQCVGAVAIRRPGPATVLGSVSPWFRVRNGYCLNHDFRKIYKMSRIRNNHANPDNPMEILVQDEITGI